MRIRSPLRLGVIAAGAFLIVAATAMTASAHVRVVSYTPAIQGGYAALVFRVPTEEQSNTVSLTVSMPEDTPLASVSVMQKTGWTVAVTKSAPKTPLQTDDGPVTSVVTAVTWTANAGGGIPPDGFDEFSLSVGPLPKVTSLAFPSVQTYANGDVVRWIEPTPASGQAPDHPVPVLGIVPAGAATPSSNPSATPATDAADVSTRPAGDDDTARGLGIAGIALGALGLLSAVGFAARRRT